MKKFITILLTVTVVLSLTIAANALIIAPEEFDTIEELTEFLRENSELSYFLIPQNIPEGFEITLIDYFPGSIGIYLTNASNQRIIFEMTCVVVAWGAPPINGIWSEGAIDCIGFEKGLTHWYGFLKDVH